MVISNLDFLPGLLLWLIQGELCFWCRVTFVMYVSHVAEGVVHQLFKVEDKHNKTTLTRVFTEEAWIVI